MIAREPAAPPAVQPDVDEHLETSADDLSPPTRSPAVKIATLLFSGGLAALAIVRGASGCTAPTAVELDDEEEVELLPRWRKAKGSATPPRPHRIRPAAMDDPLAEDVDPTTLRYLGGVKADPDAMNTRELAPAARYFGGSKSDSDVWGGLTATEVGAKPELRPPARGRIGR